MTEHNDIQGFFDDVKKEKLTDSERIFARNDLTYFMSTHPIRIPLHIQVYDSLVEGFSKTSRNTVHNVVARPITTALVLTLFMGVGTSYAAEGALPGDSLYPVKIQVNEKIQGALALSDEAKADFYASRAERRLEEVELLTAQGRLTEDAKAQIESGIDISTGEYNAHLAAMKKVPSKEIKVADSEAHFEAALAAHEDVLARLSTAVPKAKDTLTPIIDNVHAQAIAVQQERIAFESSWSDASNTPQSKAVAHERKQRAENKLKDIRALVESARANGKKGQVATTTESTTVTATENDISHGNAQLDNGDYGGAMQTYQAAIRAADAVQINADIKARLRHEINLLGDD